MAIPRAVRHFYEFGNFRLDADKHRLLRDGEVVPLPPKAIEALIVLVQHAGELLEREALMQAVWADTFVEDANLTVAISQVRKALGQNGEIAEYIETIPRIGYRFVAEVREAYEEPRPLIIEKHTQTRTVIEEEVFPDQKDEPQLVSTTVAIPVTLPTYAVIFGAGSRGSRTIKRLVALGLVVLAVGALVAYRLKARSDAGAAVETIRSVAVMPLKNLTGDPGNECLSEGLTDGLINALSRIDGLKVASRGSVFGLKGKEIDPRDVGKRLGVTTILEGSLLSNKDYARVSVRLVNAEDGRVIWSGDGAEHSLADVFAIQDELARDVISAVRPRTSGESLLSRQQTPNKDAYALYLQGNYLWNKRGSEGLKSLDYFRKAIELDPNFAQAYVSLAAAGATTSLFSPETEALIDKALLLDDTSAEAHATRAFIKMFQRWDWATAENELDRSVELNPNSSIAHHWKGVYLSIRGRLDEAKAEMHRALDLDPLSLIIMTDIGQLHYFAHEYDQASEYCNRALTFDPQFHDAHTYLVDIYRMKGMDREGLNEFIQDFSMNPKSADATRELFAREGLRGLFNQDLQSRLKGFKSEDDRRNVLALMIGRCYCRLGDTAGAVRWLAVAVEKPQSFWTPYLAVDPLYDPLRNDARFKEILRRIGLGT